MWKVAPKTKQCGHHCSTTLYVHFLLDFFFFLPTSICRLARCGLSCTSVPQKLQKCVPSFAAALMNLKCPQSQTKSPSKTPAQMSHPINQVYLQKQPLWSAVQQCLHSQDGLPVWRNSSQRRKTMACVYDLKPDLILIMYKKAIITERCGLLVTDVIWKLGR